MSERESEKLVSRVLLTGLFREDDADPLEITFDRTLTEAEKKRVEHLLAIAIAEEATGG